MKHKFVGSDPTGMDANSQYIVLPRQLESLRLDNVRGHGQVNDPDPLATIRNRIFANIRK